MEKDKRKVNLVGQNTLTVSLPIIFVKNNNIEKGDKLFAYYDKNEITFSLEEVKKMNKEIFFNIDNFSYYALVRYLGILYMTNYNKITLTYSKNTILYNKTGEEESLNKIVKKIVERFLGAEIVSCTSKKTEIECFISQEEKDLEKIEKRIYFLLKDTISEMFEGIDNNFKEFYNNSYEYHDNICKFVYYFLRQLDFSSKSENEKKAAYSFYSFVNTLVDEIRHISEQIYEFGCSKKLRGYLEEIFDLFFEMFMEFVYKTRIKQEVIEKRYNLVNKIKKENFDVKELQVLSEAKIFLDTINTFSEYSIVKGLNNDLINHK